MDVLGCRTRYIGQAAELVARADAATIDAHDAMAPRPARQRPGIGVGPGVETVSWWRNVVNLILLVIILIILFGGGGFYFGGPYVGGGLGTILLIVLIVLLVRG